LILAFRTALVLVTELAPPVETEGDAALAAAGNTRPSSTPLIRLNRRIPPLLLPA
jgi:hypothetical protein